MSRVDQERVSVTISGIKLGVFDSFAGGAAKAEDTKNRPGGMGPEESLGGPTSRDAFTLGRLYNLERDHPLMKTLDGLVGAGRVVAVRQKLNRDKSPAGDPITYTGTMMAYTMPDHDSNSGDKAVFSIEVSADEPIS